MSDTSYRYWAFLSYSSKDLATCKKLHRQLETYRLPRSLVGRPGRDEPIPKKIFPVFRDREELPLSSDLGDSIREAIRQSRYLIVIGSPSAVESRWVNEEIRYFKSLGRADRIMVLIVEGEPGATENPAATGRECFPPALRFQVDEAGEITSQPSEPMAGDLRKGKDGWTRAFLKLVAGIVGVGFDTLAQRERQRRRKRQAIQGAIAMVALSAAGWYWDAYWRTHTDYYRFVQGAYGGYVGKAPIAATDMENRNFAIAFTRRGRLHPVSEIRAVGSQGKPIEPILGMPMSVLGQQIQSNYSQINQRQVCQIRLSYDQAGQVVREEGFYIDDSLAYALHYVAPDVVSFQVGGIERRRAPGIASRARLKYREEEPGRGLLAEVRFMDPFGEPAERDLGAKMEGAGLYGFRITYETEGDAVTRARLVMLDQEGEPFLVGGMASLDILYKDSAIPEAISIWANDPTTGEPFEVNRITMLWNERGDFETIEMLNWSSSGTEPVSLQMDANHEYSRFEAEAEGMTVHSYLGTVGRTMLEELKFDVIYSRGNEEQMDMILAPSHKFANGAYTIPGYVFVRNVPPESPGQFAGLQSQDLILNYGDAEIHDVETLLATIREHEPSDSPIPARILRNGQKLEIELPPGALDVYVEPTTAVTAEFYHGQ